MMNLRKFLPWIFFVTVSLHAQWQDIMNATYSDIYGNTRIVLTLQYNESSSQLRGIRDGGAAYDTYKVRYTQENTTIGTYAEHRIETWVGDWFYVGVCGLITTNVPAVQEVRFEAIVLPADEGPAYDLVLTGKTSGILVIDTSTCTAHLKVPKHKWNWSTTVTNTGTKPFVAGLVDPSNPNVTLAGGTGPRYVGVGQTVTLTGTTYTDSADNSGSVDLATYGIGNGGGGGLTYSDSSGNAVTYSDISLIDDPTITYNSDTNATYSGEVEGEPSSAYRSQVSDGTGIVKSYSGNGASTEGTYTNDSGSPTLVTTYKYDTDSQKLKQVYQEVVSDASSTSLVDSDYYQIKKTLAEKEGTQYIETEVLDSDTTDTDGPVVIPNDDSPTGEVIEIDEDLENPDDGGTGEGGEPDLEGIAQEVTLQSVNGKLIQIRVKTDSVIQENQKQTTALESIDQTSKEAKQVLDSQLEQQRQTNQKLDDMVEAVEGLEIDLDEIIDNQEEQIDIEEARDEKEQEDRTLREQFADKFKSEMLRVDSEWGQWARDMADEWVLKAKEFMESRELEENFLMNFTPDKNIGSCAKPNTTISVPSLNIEIELPLDEWKPAMNWVRNAVQWILIIGYFGYIAKNMKQVIDVAYQTPQAKGNTEAEVDATVFKLKSRFFIALAMGLLIIGIIMAVPTLIASSLTSAGALDVVDILGPSPFSNIPPYVQNGMYIIDQLLPVGVMVTIMVNSVVMIVVMTVVQHATSGLIKLMAI